MPLPSIASVARRIRDKAGELVGKSAGETAGETAGKAAAEVAPRMGSPSNGYNTRLSSDEERAFAKWKERFAPKDSGDDYDLRGAYLAGVTPDAKTAHWPDTFKKPNHETFSDESQYARFAPDLAGHWDGDEYTPAAANRRTTE